MLTLANSAPSSSHDSPTPAHIHSPIVVAVGDQDTTPKKTKPAKADAQKSAKVKEETEVMVQAEPATVAQPLAVDTSQSTLEVQAPARNEDEHETIEFDPKLVEAVVRETESASKPEGPKASNEPVPLFDASADDHEDASAHEASEPQGDDLAAAELDSGLPAEQKTTPMPILMDSDTTFDDIPLADEAMSIDDAWSVFMDDHDDGDDEEDDKSDE